MNVFMTLLYDMKIDRIIMIMYKINLVSSITRLVLEKIILINLSSNYLFKGVLEDLYDVNK